MSRRSYIAPQRKITAWTCNGYCSDYFNVRMPRAKFWYSYAIHGLRFCPTCEHVYKESDWKSFPYPRFCICCKKPLRTRVCGSRCKEDWRKRY